MKELFKRAAFLSLALLMLLALPACANKQSAAAAYTVDTVTLTYVKSPLNVPSIVQKAQNSFEGAYAAMGLKTAYSQLSSGADQTAALASGDIQILNAVGGTSVILSAANGADIKIIGMYSSSPKAFKLFSADDTIDAPEKLRGKTIAGPKGTNLHELLAAYLATAGMTLEDVNFVSMDIPSSLAALESGSVDCALQAGASADNCQSGGMHLVTDGEGLIAGAILTATTQDFYDKNPEIVRAFRKVQDETLDFINNNHDEAMRMAAEETGLALSAVEEMFTLYDFHADLTQADMQALADTGRFMFENGLIENEVDISSLVLDME